MDIDTPSSVFDAVRRAVKAHVEAETKDFTGECSVNVIESDEPMKLTMSVWWKHCYNGDPDAVFVFVCGILLPSFCKAILADRRTHPITLCVLT